MTSERRFGVLGPLEVVLDSVDRTPSSRRQRMLLARLCLTPRQAVSSDSLVDELWGEQGTGPKTLAFHVSRLRDWLEPDRPRGDPGTLIATTSYGYALTVEDSEIDRVSFERLVAEARALVDTNPAGAGKVAGQALTLWRGDPLPDLADMPSVAQEARRWNELRLLAEEILLEGKLAEGGHREVVAELDRLHREHPWRDQTTTLLMTALHRSGRSVEALEVFAATRASLAERGLDVSASLANLEERILLDDHTLGLSDEVAGIDGVRHNLPRRVNSYIDRPWLKAMIESALQTDGLVTLTGPGGIGKTRCAVETARKMVDQYEDGLWLVELASITQAERVWDQLATTLGLFTTADLRAEEAVLRFVESRNLLLVLDNCEHLVEPVSHAAAMLVEAGVRILATSRKSLGVPGESVLVLPPLEIAGVEQSPDAVRLFVVRAHSVRSDLEFDDAALAAATRICARLDGMPLAIELAAARVRSLGLAELADRLDRSLTALGSGPRAGAERHRTLEAAIGWSHQLLASEQQMVFRRLAVFVGGFDLAAVEAVCFGGRSDRPFGAAMVADIVDGLVDHSLVTVTSETSLTVRYRLLEPVRQFAAARLAEVVETEMLREAHARHYAAIAFEAGPHVRSGRQLDWIRRLEADNDNLRAALTTLTAIDVDSAMTMGVELSLYWEITERFAEAIEMLVPMMEVAGGDPRLRIRTLFELSNLGPYIQYRDSLGCAEQGLEMARSMGNDHDERMLLLALNWCRERADPVAAAQLGGLSAWAGEQDQLWWEREYEDLFMAEAYASWDPVGSKDPSKRVEVIETARMLGERNSLMVALINAYEMWGVAPDDWVLAALAEMVEVAEEVGATGAAALARSQHVVHVATRDGWTSDRLLEAQRAADTLKRIGGRPLWEEVALRVQIEGEISCGNREYGLRELLHHLNAVRGDTPDRRAWTVCASYVASQLGDHTLAARWLMAAGNAFEQAGYRRFGDTLRAAIGDRSWNRERIAATALGTDGALSQAIEWTRNQLERLRQPQLASPMPFEREAGTRR